MVKAVHLVLIVGFLVVDALLFHDVFKAGEKTTAVEVLIGVLSICVFVTSAGALLRARAERLSSSHGL
jgi:hypothetical protein